MRFTALALGALGFAGFAVGEADPMLTRTIKSHIVSGSPTRTFEVTPIFHVEAPAVTGFHIADEGNPEVSSSCVTSSSSKRLTRAHPPPTSIYNSTERLTRAHPPPTFHVEAPAVTSSHSIYSESCGWGYFPIETTRPYISCSSFWTGGISGGRSCTATATWVGPGCSQTLCSSGSIPIQPTATSDSVSCFKTTPLFTRTPRWVAQFARATPAVAAPIEALPAAAREARLDAKFAARATQGLDEAAGREARLDAKFAARAAREAHLDPQFETLPEAAREAHLDPQFETLPEAAREAHLDAKFAARAAREAHLDPQFESLPEAAREARMDAKFAARAAREAHVDPQFESLPEAAREAHVDAKFAARAAREAHLDPQFESLPEAAREAHLDAKFAARAAREAHHVPKFGPSHAITPAPRAAQITPPPFPICSFDLDKGQYVCPLPLCTFDLSKGEYVCPKVAPRTAMPAEIVVEVVATTLKTVVKA